MGISSLVKEIWIRCNPFAFLRKHIMRKRLHNTNITFLCPNCIGGILFHDLGLKFMSPTVNLMMTQPDFVKFVLNINDYLKQEFQFYNHPEYNCPCAYLGDISVHFTHYKSNEEALTKWKDRVTRIQKEKYVCFFGRTR